MLELPEVRTISRQAREALTGKVITQVFSPTTPHKFAFFNGDGEDYKPLLTGKKVMSTEGAGMYVDLILSDGVVLSLGDGVNFRYGDASAKIPEKYQLMLTFDNETFLAFNIAMYGAIYAHRGDFDNKYYRQSKEKISPLADAFDEDYFNGLLRNEKKNISVKAFLATEQRIPGLGNGVLQDILFYAGIHPKRKIDTLSKTEKSKLFKSVKDTLKKMTREGGRDTETDFYGNKGGYSTVVSAKTYKNPCPVCGGTIMREDYMGGRIYYCPTCQPL